MADSQEPIGMTLVREYRTVGRQNLKRPPTIDRRGPPVEGWEHQPTFRIFDPELFLYKKKCMDKNGAESAGVPTQ